jgi:GH15 family glucan-1,4-alpha-glucosidase
VTAYLPIGEHGVIGDLHTIALVGTDGTIDWFCSPHFDSPSVFASILDAERGGRFRISPAVEDWRSKQLYFPDTNVLITRFLTPDGVSEVQDFMTIAGADEEVHPHRLVRRILVVRGEMRFAVEVAPRFNYGRDEHRIRVHDEGAVFLSSDLSLALSASVPFDVRSGDVHAAFTLRAGEAATFVLARSRRDAAPERFSEHETREAFESTIGFWRHWLAQSRYRGR